MICTDVRALLNLLCDDALDARDAAMVLDHLRSCTECDTEWKELENLRADFHTARAKIVVPPGLNERIFAGLKREEQEQHHSFIKRSAKNASLLAIAASLALIGYFTLPVMQKPGEQLVLSQAVSAAALIEDYAEQKPLEQAKDRSELNQKVGFELKQVPLPEWRLKDSAVYRAGTPLNLARFDFVRAGKTGQDYLTCYQGKQGTIKAGGPKEIVAGKEVIFGRQGGYQFALWSQNDRDYLFITELSKAQLRGIVEKT
jgi:anti-sigma factor RsiW